MLNPMTRPMPTTDELLELANAALSNAEELLNDAVLLAEAGRFPRAYALAALACEESAKSSQCLSSTWSICTPGWFWARFNNHPVKLEPIHLRTILESGKTIESESWFVGRVRSDARSAHARKLRGLYVDLMEGVIQNPSDINDQQALEMINTARAEIELSRRKWPALVTGVQRLSELPELARVLIIVFVGWVIITHHETAVAFLREPEWSPAITALLGEFAEQIKQDGFYTVLMEVGEKISLPSTNPEPGPGVPSPDANDTWLLVSWQVRRQGDVLQVG
jgi:AbiV family abortive infection protein